MKKMLCAVTLLLVGSGLAIGQETVTGRITKVEGNKITVTTGGGFGKQKTEAKETVYTVAKNAKIVRATFSFQDKKAVPGEALEGGLKNEIFQNLGKKKDDDEPKKKFGKGGFGRRGGVFANIVIENNQVTEIRVIQFGGKKGGKGGKKKGGSV